LETQHASSAGFLHIKYVASGTLITDVKVPVTITRGRNYVMEFSVFQQTQGLLARFNTKMKDDTGVLNQVSFALATTSNTNTFTYEGILSTMLATESTLNQFDNYNLDDSAFQQGAQLFGGLTQSILVNGGLIS
jgi:hypothetical protein